MASHLFSPKPNINQAYYTDGNHEWFGDAPRGATTDKARWRIFKIEYSTPADFESSWIIKWVNGSDEPKFIWDNVAGYTYELLKDR
jgi:ABC-type uncharacterized transport system permease subunit